MTLEGGVRETPGALTSTFRAARAPVAPRTLRVALGVAGRIVLERRFERGDRVTIGERPDVSFTVGAAELGDRWVLFEVDGKGARLRVPPGSRGRVRGPDGVVPIDGQAGRVIALSDDARGVLTLGDVTLLFSFEARPPKVAAALPLGLRRGVELDAQTFLLAALSFLAHFGAFGALYSDWADPVFDDDLTVSALLEAVHALPSAPLIVEEAPDASATPATAKADAPADTPKPSAAGASRNLGRSSAVAAPATGPRPISDRDAASLSRDLAEMDVMMQGALGANGPSTDRVLRDDPTVLGMLDDVARRDVGVRPGLAFGSSPGSDDLRGRAGSLADLGNRSGDTSAHRGTDRATSGPDHAAPAPTTPPTGTGDVPGANGVIAAMSGAFHRCYQKGLDHEDPTMQGSIRVLTRVGPNGEVTSASPRVSGNLSGTVVSCVQRKIMGAQFSPPTGGGTATLMIPVTLAHQ